MQSKGQEDEDLNWSRLREEEVTPSLSITVSGPLDPLAAVMINLHHSLLLELLYYN